MTHIVYGSNAAGLARRKADELERTIQTLEEKLNEQTTDVVSLMDRIKTLEDAKKI